MPAAMMGRPMLASQASSVMDSTPSQDKAVTLSRAPAARGASGIAPSRQVPAR